MISSRISFLGSILVFMVASSWATYTMVDDYNPSNFFTKFDFFTAPDPTNGFVQYVDQATAQDNGLIFSTDDSVYLGVDHKTVSSSGRASVRISSRQIYTQGLFVIDITHMPGGICGTWPAFWTVGPRWPMDGEIDIVEQVNLASTNQMTLHTRPGCLLSGATQRGSAISENCFGYANSGCGVMDHNSQSFGSIFNQGGGGAFAMEWTSDYIAIWFWPRGGIPSNVLSEEPDPSQWDAPVAKFEGDGCDIDAHFREHQIVIDTTFCGDWAGNEWATSGCIANGPSCTEYVANNPSAFIDAYWEINSLKVFQRSDEQSPEEIAEEVPPGSPTEPPECAPAESPAEIPADEPAEAPTEVVTQTVVGLQTEVPTEAPDYALAETPARIEGYDSAGALADTSAETTVEIRAPNPEKTPC